jgi:hypothetical protein
VSDKTPAVETWPKAAEVKAGSKKALNEVPPEIHGFSKSVS